MTLLAGEGLTLPDSIRTLGGMLSDSSSLWDLLRDPDVELAPDVVRRTDVFCLSDPLFFFTIVPFLVSIDILTTFMNFQ